MIAVNFSKNQEENKQTNIFSSVDKYSFCIVDF